MTVTQSPHPGHSGLLPLDTALLGSELQNLSGLCLISPDLKDILQLQPQARQAETRVQTAHLQDQLQDLGGQISLGG